jgi:hypothetical protein
MLSFRQLHFARGVNWHTENLGIGYHLRGCRYSRSCFPVRQAIVSKRRLEPGGGRRKDIRLRRKSLYHRLKLLRHLFHRCMLRLFISFVSTNTSSARDEGKERSKDVPSKVKATCPWLLQFLTT